MPSSDLQLLVFDLDGTLVDSQRDLANSVNATLQHLGCGSLPDALIATYIGDGAAMLVRRALARAAGAPPSEDESAHALEFFLRYYRDHKLDFTYAYDGVLAALQQIRQADAALKIAVLTNKPVRPSRQICDALGLTPFFFQNYGGDSFVTKKPDPEGLLTLMLEANVEHSSQCVMVGDSGVDILTARNAGARSLGCTFGLAPDAMRAAKPDMLCDSAWEWPALLGF